MQTPKPDIHDLTTQAVSLQKRLASIDAQPHSFAHGLQEVGRGLETILTNLAPPQNIPETPTPETPTPDTQRTDIMRAHLLALLQGLEGIADYLTHTEPAPQTNHQNTQNTQNPFAGLQQFIAAFRKEAQKRLAGLSISMMGIFNEHTSTPALEQSAGHLHAVRGGAAMLGLNEIAELAATMEQVMVTMGRIDAKDRIWPTKTLLQGYALLRDATENDDVRIDTTASTSIVTDLRHCLAELAPNPTHASPKTEAPPQKITAPSAILRRAPANEDSEPPEVIANLIENTNPDLQTYEQRILIVDDIDTIAASIGFVLSDLDVAMDVAHDGQIALHMLREQPYSLVISDVAMPNMDGLELTRTIRADPHLKHLPLILLTSLSQPEEQQAGLDAGANDYLIKGTIGGGALISRVEELLKAAPFVAPRNDTHNSTQPWKILVAEDTETVAASIAFVLSEGPYDITLAHDGQDALRQLQHRYFDLLITDVQMPRMDGIELTQAVRAKPTLQNLPIIMLTSLDADEDRQRGLTVGVDRYLIKGEVAGGKLLHLMNELLSATTDL